ncbi:uncharacterized protein [Periplaneta americana]|uniref:uncharacterized protein isoform X9 n=1 Tax=Periplaneta americana TaxID=6978 RepID=UPI0037E8467A
MNKFQDFSVLMDVIKTEPDTNPLDTQYDDRNGEEYKPLAMDKNFLKVDIGEIKEEPSDLICDFISNIKCEDYDVPNTFPELKSEVKAHAAARCQSPRE